jgi:hypothetical protein
MTGLVTEWRGRGEPIALAVVAAILFVAEGFYLLVSAVPLPFGSLSLPAAGATEVAVGLSVLFLALFYRTYGGARSYFGTLIVLLAAGDLWFGGGFWAGSLLASVAGALIIALPPYPTVSLPA